MDKQVMDLVLPRLAQRLHGQLKRYRAGKLSDAQFSRSFESLLQRQYAFLADQGIPEVDAAVAIHASVVVLSGPGLRAEATERGVPLEVVEYQAVRTAAEDISQNYNTGIGRTLRQLSTLVAQYAD